MSYIYKIINDLNDKVYVGKTNLTIEERFRQHCQDAKKETELQRPLYNAMNKYGSEHFQIIEIEQCSPENASEREIYWIGYYKGYEDGYNATKGGDGKNLFNHMQIAERLKSNPYPIEIAKEFNCSSDLVRIIAKEFDIPIKNKGQENVNAKKRIAQYTKDNQFVQEFESTQKAAEWIYSHGLCLTLSSGTRGHISNAATGKKRTAYGYKWKYI